MHKLSFGMTSTTNQIRSIILEVLNTELAVLLYVSWSPRGLVGALPS